MSTFELPLLFHSPTTFEQTFLDGLSQLLDERGLGGFVLVLANATISEPLFAALQDRLKKTFTLFASEYQSAFKNGHTLFVAEDDLLVFLKLALTGFHQLNVTQFRQEAFWQVQFNHLRSFRPPRITQLSSPKMRTAFNDKSFHFNKPFLLKECIWEGELLGKDINLFYNKYPFTELHCLLIPEKPQQHQHFLTESWLRYAWRVAECLGQDFPHLKMGYNTLGAYASVNHLHFQVTLGTRLLCVEHPRWRHNGGQLDYPITTYTHTDPASAWQQMDDCQRRQQPFNVLFTPGKLYCWPRKPQGAYLQPDWTCGFTWWELAGHFITFNQAHYTQVNDDMIRQNLATLTPTC